VNRPTETSGYRALVEMGLEEYAFEIVILRHPQLFSAEAVERSRQRMASRRPIHNSPVLGVRRGTFDDLFSVEAAVAATAI